MVGAAHGQRVYKLLDFQNQGPFIHDRIAERASRVWDATNGTMEGYRIEFPCPDREVTKRLVSSPEGELSIHLHVYITGGGLIFGLQYPIRLSEKKLHVESPWIEVRDVKDDIVTEGCFVRAAGCVPEEFEQWLLERGKHEIVRVERRFVEFIERGEKSEFMFLDYENGPLGVKQLKTRRTWEDLTAQILPSLPGRPVAA